jgi:hypothetical protein
MDLTGWEIALAMLSFMAVGLALGVWYFDR